MLALEWISPEQSNERGSSEARVKSWVTMSRVRHLLCDLAKQSENLLAGIRIKRTGRLIGKQDLASPAMAGRSLRVAALDRKLIV